MRPVIHLLIIMATFLMVAGCGYSVVGHGSLAFDSIYIKKITNITSEPKLQDKLFRALTEEFMRHGVEVTSASENVLEGKIFSFKLTTLSEKREYAAEYEVIIKSAFTLKDSSGVKKEIKNISSPFIESFTEIGSVNEIIARKEVASEKALKSLAMKIVTDLIYENY